jgi:hypothetical protein
METVICPHCGEATASDSAFCEACGKAVPSARPAGPRVVDDRSLATTGAGRALVGEQLHQSMKRASTALLVVAVLQTIFGPIMLMIQKRQMEEAAGPGAQVEIEPVAYVIVFGIAAVFWALYFWARRNPLPAAIVGLVLFLTLHLIDAIADPTTLARGWLMKILIVAMLCQAISAGVKYRRLSQDDAEPLPAV